MQQGEALLSNDYSTQGTIINSTGDGMVTIDNPALGQRLRLDMRNPLNPRRYEELSGDPDVWVDFSFGGAPELGTYSAPFNTLEEGVNAVPEGGIVKILPGSRGGSFSITKALTLDAPGGLVTIGN